MRAFVPSMTNPPHSVSLVSKSPRRLQCCEGTKLTRTAPTRSTSHQPSCTPSPSPTHRGHVVVIVVAVRHQRRVDARQLRGLQRGWHVAADEARDALGKNGIDGQRHSLELHQPTGVRDPGDARRLARSGRAREQRSVGLDARHVGLGWAAAATAGQLVEHRPAEHVGAAVRARAVEVEEAHGSLDERRKSAAAICLLQFLAVNAPNENQNENHQRKRKPQNENRSRCSFSLLVLVARSRCSFSLLVLVARSRCSFSFSFFVLRFRLWFSFWVFVGAPRGRISGQPGGRRAPLNRNGRRSVRLHLGQRLPYVNDSIVAPGAASRGMEVRGVNDLPQARVVQRPARIDHEVQYRTIHGYQRAFIHVGQGPALLLIHGIGDCSDTWRELIPQLAHDHTVIAPDLLGHGRSDKPRADYSVAAYANAMRDLLSVIGVERVTVIGHSFGGGVAMQFAYQYPERCERLVLVSTG